MRRLICIFVFRIWLKQVFSWRGSNHCQHSTNTTITHVFTAFKFFKYLADLLKPFYGRIPVFCVKQKAISISYGSSELCNRSSYMQYIMYMYTSSKSVFPFLPSFSGQHFLPAASLQICFVSIFFFQFNTSTDYELGFTQNSQHVFVMHFCINF